MPKIAAKAPGVISQFICHEYEGVTFSFISPSCSKVFELKASEIQADAQRLISLIHPEDVESFYNSLAVASKTLKTWQWEGRFILPSGQLKYIYASSEPEQQPNGEIIWDGLLMDITHRLHAETQLQAEIIERQGWDFLSAIRLLSKNITGNWNVILLSEWVRNLSLRFPSNRVILNPVKSYRIEMPDQVLISYLICYVFCYASCISG